MATLRSLPSVDQLLLTPAVVEWIAAYGRPLTVEAIRCALEDTRQVFYQHGTLSSNPEILDRAARILSGWTTPSLGPVINATGVILHTNLGRAPLSHSALQAIMSTSEGYSNLEYDLRTGRRGSRLNHADELLRHLTGAGAALVVNNNAAGVLLVLSALARRRSVVIARSQLVEIGGGFRVPDVMKQSGARLIEVGTTNRVHLSDYETAVAEEGPVALILRAHRSNFRIIGFTSEPSLSEISALAHRSGIPVVDDLGSGSLLDTSQYGLAHEPTIYESLEGGADLVCFSGDKLLGGPQAGIILGRADLIEKLKKHPLARAIRADKLCLAALNATLMHYLKGEAEKQIPIWRMISASIESLQARAQAWVDDLGQGEVYASASTVGGGSLPGETLPTRALALLVPAPNRFLERLLSATPPIVARLVEGRILFDPRTISPEQDDILLKILKTTLSR